MTSSIVWLVEIESQDRSYAEDLPWGCLGSEEEEALVELMPGSLLSGSTVYTCMLNHRGGTESDLTVSRLASGTQASPLTPAFEGKAMRSLGMDVTSSGAWLSLVTRRSERIVWHDYIITCHVHLWPGPGD